MEIEESAASLKRRWTSGAGRELAQTVQQRILDNATLDGLGLREIGGRSDLRYIPFPAAIRELRGVRLRDLDLSGSMLANVRIIDSSVDGCLFEEANLQFWHLRGTSVGDCSFAKADLRNSTLGEWFEGSGNTYRRVSFESARLVRSTTSAAVYEDCDFSFAQLDRVNFWQSSLVRCKFAGPVREVIFDGRWLGEGKPTRNPMDQVDFSGAVLDGCEFRGVTFDSVRLPPDPALIRIRDLKVVERAAAALANVPGHPHAAIAKVVLDQAREVMAMGGEELLNLRDVEPAGELLSSILKDADKG